MKSQFEKMIKDYSNEDKLILLESYQNKFNILSAPVKSPFVTICSKFTILNMEYKFNETNQVILN